MNHVQIGYAIVGIPTFYQHALIACVNSRSLMKFCLILFDIVFSFCVYCIGLRYNYGQY